MEKWRKDIERQFKEKNAMTLKTETNASKPNVAPNMRMHNKILMKHHFLPVRWAEIQRLAFLHW